jgi:hypothetical protein
MATTTHARENNKPEKVHAFKPINFDVKTSEPEAQVGQYEAIIHEIKVTKTSTDGYPMLIVEWKLDSAEDEENKKSEGATVPDFIALFPEGDSKGRMGKLRLRQLCEGLEIDLDTIPTRIEEPSDFDDFIKVAKRQRMTVWVTHRTDKSTNEVRVGVAYAAPKSTLPPVERDEEDEDEAPRARKAAGAKKSARR